MKGVSFLSCIALLLLSPTSTLLADQRHSEDWVKEQVFTSGVEGPAVNSKGELFAVNFAKEGTIGKVTAQHKASHFITLPEGSVGNGIRFDKQDNMYIADYAGHNILRVDAGTEVAYVFSHQPKMNQPNDIAMMDSGILFASDPNWSNSSGQLWRIDTDGVTQLLESDMGTTNGVEVSPDNKRLYVNESVQRKVWVYDLTMQGEISNKRLLIEFADHGLDGMRTDIHGNLYIARYGAGVVAVVSASGEQLEEIRLKGQHPTNVAFGGEDGRSLFITMQKRGAIEHVRVKYAGRTFM